MDAVLVTGGLGFIGSRLCEALLDDGARVRCVDDLSGSYAPAPGRPLRRALAARGAEVLVDERRPGHVDGVDAVIHLAGRPGVRSTRPVAELHAANVALGGAARRGRGAQGRPLRARLELVGVRQRRRAPHAGARAARAAEPLRREQGGRRGGGARARGRSGRSSGRSRSTGPASGPTWRSRAGSRRSRRGEPVPWHAAPGTARDFTFVDDAVAGLMAALRARPRGRGLQRVGRAARAARRGARAARRRASPSSLTSSRSPAARRSSPRAADGRRWPSSGTRRAWTGGRPRAPARRR